MSPFWNRRASIFVFRDMNTEIFSVENLKCQGCVNSVRKRLLREMDVAGVDVDLVQGQVKVSFQHVPDRERIANALAELGYPEHGKGNFLQKGKSYVSCAIGRLEKD